METAIYILPLRKSLCQILASLSDLMVHRMMHICRNVDSKIPCFFGVEDQEF